jgi:hypothetical protein
MGGVTSVPSPDLTTWVRRSHLRYTFATIQQHQAAVKFHGVFEHQTACLESISRQEILVPLEDS